MQNSIIFFNIIYFFIVLCTPEIPVCYDSIIFAMFQPFSYQEILPQSTTLVIVTIANGVKLFKIAFLIPKS
jgi:hypothetical protein